MQSSKPTMRLRELALAAVLIAVAVPSASAQTVSPNQDPAAAEKAERAEKDKAAAALRAYDTGVKAYEAGKHKEAITALSSALSTGGLPSNQMAKALYYRGASYRKQGKPAQAISDLTTSVWLKNGLMESDKTAAMSERQAAYQEAGLGETPVPVGTAPLDQPGGGKPGTQTVAVASESSSGGVGGFFSNLFSSSSSSPAAPATAPPQPASEPVAAAPPQPASSSWDAATSTSSSAPTTTPPAAGFADGSPPPAAASEPSAFATTTEIAAPEAPQPTQPTQVAQVAQVASNEPASSSSSVSGFFSNLFGGGSSATPPSTPSSDVSTSATPPQPAVSSFEPQTADWGAGTSVAAPDASSGTRGQRVAERAPPPAPTPLPATSPKSTSSQATSPPQRGNYDLQVAAVRSADEAQQLASRLVSDHGSQIGGRQPTIDEKVIGSMGTFYRVKVGPYADANEPAKVCGAIRSNGFDCLVVTR